MRKKLLILFFIVITVTACCFGTVFLMQSREVTVRSTPIPAVSPTTYIPTVLLTITASPDAAAPIFATQAAAETQYAATVIAMTPHP